MMELDEPYSHGNIKREEDLSENNSCPVFIKNESHPLMES